MEWFFLSLLRAFFMSGKEASVKVSLLKPASTVTIASFYMAVISVIILMPYVIWDGSWRSILNAQFVYGVLGNIGLNIFSYLLLLTTIRRFEISYVAAILAASPLIFGGFSIVFLGESPGLYAFLFMGLIAIGAIFVELSRKQLSGFKNFILHSGWLPLFVYLCLAAGATVFSKIAVTNGDPEAYIAFRYTGLSIVFLIIHCIYESSFGTKILRRNRDPVSLNWNPGAAITGFFVMLAVICEMNALALTDMARVEAVTKFSIVLTLLADAFFISKNISWQRWIGVFFILFGGIGILLCSG